MCTGSEEGSYLRFTDFGIIQLAKRGAYLRPLASPLARPLSHGGRSHLQTLVINEFGFNQSYHTFTSKLPIKIVMCSRFPGTKFTDHKCFDMGS